jgi:CheY-like chemotaxis protein
VRPFDKAKERAGMARERVLIVEGDRVRRGLVATYLEAAGFAVIEASSGEEAFSRLRRERTRIGRLVLGRVPATLVCAAMLADEFSALHRGREAVSMTDASPADVAASLQRAAAPTPEPRPVAPAATLDAAPGAWARAA